MSVRCSSVSEPESDSAHHRGAVQKMRVLGQWTLGCERGEHCYANVIKMSVRVSSVSKRLNQTPTWTQFTTEGLFRK